MPPLPSIDSMWYWPSSVESTSAVASSSRTSPSDAQKLTLSSYFALQTGQYFIRGFGFSSQQSNKSDTSGMLKLQLDVEDDGPGAALAVKFDNYRVTIELDSCGHGLFI